MPLHRSESPNNNWATPPTVRDRVWGHFGFPALDVATTEANPMQALRYYTPADNALIRSWAVPGGYSWGNTPYTGRFYKKCAEEAEAGKELLLLLPGKAGTRWFQAIVEHATLIGFWRGRLTFEGATAPAPFESALIYTGDKLQTFRNAFSDVCWIVGGGKAARHAA